jgi:predicted N-formylglutamate amidohydrolase
MQSLEAGPTERTRAPVTATPDLPPFDPLVEAGAPAPFLFVCEHASNYIPPALDGLGLPDALQRAHIAWDPGALGVARGLLAHLGGRLVSATVSRLVHDCNRPPDAPGAIVETSEGHAVPGNRGLCPAARAGRVRAAYLPFHARLSEEIALMLSAGTAPVMVTVHSFTPVWFGTPRQVELGVIHDADARLAEAVLAEALARTQLVAALNAPYSAADGVTHMLRRHALPHGLPNAMLELRNDLIADPPAQAAMADRLAPVLAAALAGLRAGAA